MHKNGEYSIIKDSDNLDLFSTGANTICLPSPDVFSRINKGFIGIDLSLDVTMLGQDHRYFEVKDSVGNIQYSSCLTNEALAKAGIYKLDAQQFNERQIFLPCILPDGSLPKYGDRVCKDKDMDVSLKLK